MKIILRAIGKNHDPIYRDAIELFTGRIAHYFPVTWQIVPNAKTQNRAQTAYAETKSLIESHEAGGVIIALDERGKSMTSEEMATLIEKQSLNSVRSLTIAIGGAYGFDQSLIRDCDFVVSLSRLTFPHQLVRLILAEQVYRACTILRGEKYHHE